LELPEFFKQYSAKSLFLYSRGNRSLSSRRLLRSARNDTFGRFGLYWGRGFFIRQPVLPEWIFYCILQSV